jgi:hypothetical protein
VERRGLEKRQAGAAVVATLLIHFSGGIALATFSGGHTEIKVEPKLCDGIRCMEDARISKRRGLEEIEADLGIIEASVVPRLGLKEEQKGYPKLQKYEQPEKIEEAVNISSEPKEKRDVPMKDSKAKPAEIDKQRKTKDLSAILGAPEDDDPRKRPTALEKIVGSPDGSVYGVGTTEMKGNIYAGKVALAIREVFVVPPFLSERELKTLKMRIRVTKINEAGQILAFEIERESANQAFDAACIRAIKQFMPKEGGNRHLPAPDATTLAYINSKGMVVDLDGALFGK